LLFERAAVAGGQDLQRALGHDRSLNSLNAWG
jgi:hypothetical protein